MLWGEVLAPTTKKECAPQSPSCRAAIRSGVRKPGAARGAHLMTRSGSWAAFVFSALMNRSQNAVTAMQFAGTGIGGGRAPVQVLCLVAWGCGWGVSRRADSFHFICAGCMTTCAENHAGCCQTTRHAVAKLPCVKRRRTALRFRHKAHRCHFHSSQEDGQMHFRDPFCTNI